MKTLFTSTKRFLLFLFFTTLFVQAANAQYNKIVAKDGSGDYTTVQAAIDAAPTTATALAPWVIYIKNGKYYEKITVPSNKPFIQIVGQSVANVILYYDDYAGKAITGGTLGTQNSASLTVNANDFTAVNITVANTFNYDSAVAAGFTGNQAVAITINADRTAFKNCKFLGQQDTMYNKGSGTPRQYFTNCYIDGIIDFLFGSAISVFDSCVIYPKTRTSSGSSYIVAPNTTTGQSYGYVFRNCKIPANTGATSYFLARPWQSNPKAVYLNCTLPYTVLPVGWSSSSAGTATVADSYFGEFKSINTNGSTTDVSQRLSGTYQLSSTDTIGYNLNNMFSGWDPKATRSEFTTYSAPEISIANFVGKKGNSSSTLSWNICWAKTGITYTLYRSSDRINFSNISQQVAANDTAINFTATDVLPANGSAYYYYVTASLPGFTTNTSDTIQISSIPTITVTGSLGSFTQSLGTPSTAQTYNVAGTNLTNNITITAPANFEISTNNTTWVASGSSITLTQSSGSIANTLIYIRLNASSINTYSGNIAHVSSGASTVSLPVTGTTQAAPLYTAALLQQWPMNFNNIDSASVRSAGVSATLPTFKNLTLSNGTTLASIPAYSTTFGQSFGASTNGDGTWSTAVGGPGGNLNRNYYEQFTVTANNNYIVRIDSVLFQSSIYLTTSNIKMAVAYSLSNFVSDSAEITSGYGPSGNLTLISDPTSGTAVFTKSFAITRSDVGPSASTAYGLAFNGASGITLAAGQTLTFRLYWSCGSTGTPRYGSLKNVIVKGTATTVLPLSLQSFTATSASSSVQLNWVTSDEVNTKAFVIERAGADNNFKQIGTKDALNNQGQNSYNFIDASPLSGINNYRLKMLDKDGAFTYSKVVAINKQLNVQFNVYPNPASNKISLVHPKTTTNATVKIVAANGSIVIAKTIAIGVTQTLLDVSSLSSGNYSIAFDDDTTHLSARFVKQ